VGWSSPDRRENPFAFFFKKQKIGMIAGLASHKKTDNSCGTIGFAIEIEELFFLKGF
jgi:hypothetical protein